MGGREFGESRLPSLKRQDPHLRSHQDCRRQTHAGRTEHFHFLFLFLEPRDLSHTHDKYPETILRGCMGLRLPTPVFETQLPPFPHLRFERLVADQALDEAPTEAHESTARLVRRLNVVSDVHCGLRIHSNRPTRPNYGKTGSLLLSVRINTDGTASGPGPLLREDKRIILIVFCTLTCDIL